MNKSIQTFLAILLLVVGASATGPYGASQPLVPRKADKLDGVVAPVVPVKPFVPDDDAALSCLKGLIYGLVEYRIANDIQKFIDRLGDPKRYVDDVIGLQNQEMPESCPKLVQDIEAVKKEHCDWLDKHPKTSESIGAAVQKVPPASFVLLVGNICANLADIRNLKEHFRLQREELLKKIGQLSVPEDVKDRMKKGNIVEGEVGDANVEEENRLAKSCSKFSKELDPIVEAIEKLSRKESDKKLFGEIVLKELFYNTNLFPSLDAYEFCKGIVSDPKVLSRTQSWRQQIGPQHSDSVPSNSTYCVLQNWLGRITHYARGSLEHCAGPARKFSDYFGRWGRQNPIETPMNDDSKEQESPPSSE